MAVCFAKLEAGQTAEALRIVQATDFTQADKGVKRFAEAIQGACHAKLGETREARLAIERFHLAMDSSSPWHAPTLYLVGRTEQWIGNAAAAKRWYQQVLRTWSLPVRDFYRVRELKEFVATH